jgi:hypothetical protein
MKRAAVCVTAAVFLLFNWTVLSFSETEKSAEDTMRQEGLITEQDYNAAKRLRTDFKQEQPLQMQNRIEVGFEISQITYKEPDVMTQKGIMYGIPLSYTMHENDLMFKAEARFSYGKVDYDGGLDDGTPYTVQDIDDYIFEGRLLIGRDFPMEEKAIITPYAGIGYRYLLDRMDKDVYGYDRESNYFYSPIGIEAMIQLQNEWSIVPTIEYDIFWHGKQISHYEDLDPIFDQIENAQESGYGYRGSIKIQKKSKNLDFVIEPFIRYWNISQSKTSYVTILGAYIVGYGWEPKNNSTEIGCKLAVKF